MKLYERLTNNIGHEHGEDIYMALNDRKIEKSIKKMMIEDRIRLLNDQKQPVYQQQIAQAATHEVEEEIVPYHKAITQHHLDATEGSIEEVKEAPEQHF